MLDLGTLLTLLIEGDLSPSGAYRLAKEARRRPYPPREALVIDVVLAQLEDHGFVGGACPSYWDLELLYLTNAALVAPDEHYHALASVIEKFCEAVSRDTSPLDMIRGVEPTQAWRIPVGTRLAFIAGVCRMLLGFNPSVSIVTGPIVRSTNESTPLERRAAELFDDLRGGLMAFVPLALRGSQRSSLITLLSEVLAARHPEEPEITTPNLNGQETGLN